MEECAYNASMARNGILSNQIALVNQAINGMDNIVKNLIYVQMEEFGILSISNVFVHKDLTGLAIIATLFKNAAEANILIQQFRNVFVNRVFNGMEELVFNATTAEHGM